MPLASYFTLTTRCRRGLLLGTKKKSQRNLLVMGPKVRSAMYRGVARRRIVKQWEPLAAGTLLCVQRY
jgi:hypothetical protein